MKAAPKEDLPRFVEPMLASPGTAPTTEGWAIEVKWDGCRAQLSFDSKSVSMRSRPGRPIIGEFPELQQLGEVLRGHRVVLDGELVCLASDGRS